MRKKNTENKQNGKSKPLPIINYLKQKKFCNKKAKNDKFLKTKIPGHAMTHFPFPKSFHLLKYTGIYYG